MPSFEKEQDDHAMEHLAVLRKGLLCGVCDDFLRDTYNLPCGHNFCQECIRDSLTDKSICPKCKIPAWPKDILKVAKADSAVSEWVNHCEAKYQVLLARAEQEEGETDSVLSGNLSQDHPVEFAEESRVASPRGISARGSRFETGRSPSKENTSLATASCLEKGSPEAMLAAKTSQGRDTSMGGMDELSTPEHDKENLEASPKMVESVSDLPAEAPRLGAGCNGANLGKTCNNSISSHKRSGRCPSESRTGRKSPDKRAGEETVDSEVMDGDGQMRERLDQRNPLESPSLRGDDEDKLSLPLVYHSDSGTRAADSHPLASCRPPGSCPGSMASAPLNRSLERRGDGMAHFVFSGKLPDTCHVQDNSSTPCSSVIKGRLIGTPPSVDAEKMENSAVSGERCRAARDTCEEKNRGEMDVGSGRHQGDPCGASITKGERHPLASIKGQVSPIPRSRQSPERLSLRGSDEGNATLGCPGEDVVIRPHNEQKSDEGGNCPDRKSADVGTDARRHVETDTVGGKSCVKRAGIDESSSGERLDVHTEQGADSQGSIPLSPPLFADQAPPSPRSPARAEVLDSCREKDDAEGLNEGCMGTVEKGGTNGESNEETLDQAEMMLGCSPASSTPKRRSPGRGTSARGAPECPGDSETPSVVRPHEMRVAKHPSPAHPPYRHDSTEGAGAFVRSASPRQATGGKNLYDQLRTTVTVGAEEQPRSRGEQERMIGGSSEELEPSPSGTSGVAAFQPRAEGGQCSADKDANELLMDLRSEYGDKGDERACDVLVDAGELVAPARDVRMPDDQQSTNVVDRAKSKGKSSSTCGNDRLSGADPAVPLPEDGGIASARSPPQTDSDETLRHEQGLLAARQSGETRGPGCGLDPQQPDREESGQPRGALAQGLSPRFGDDERSKSVMETFSSQSTVAEDIHKNDHVEDSRRAVDEHVMDSVVPESAACVGPEDGQDMGQEEVRSSQSTVGEDTQGNRDQSAPCGRASEGPKSDSFVPETLPGAKLLDEQGNSERDQGLRIQDPGISRSGVSPSPRSAPGEGGNELLSSGHASSPSKDLECNGLRGLGSCSVTGHDGSQVECALHGEPQDQAQGTPNPPQQGSDAQEDTREAAALGDSVPQELEHEEDERKSTLHSVPETATGTFMSQEIAETEEPSSSDPIGVEEGDVHETPGVQDRVPGGSLHSSVPETDQLRCRSPETQSSPTCDVNHLSAGDGENLKVLGVLLNPASGGSPDGSGCPPDPVDPWVERDRKLPKKSALGDEVSQSDKKELEVAAADDLTTGSQGMEICTGTPIILRGGSGSTASSEDGADVPPSRQAHEGFEERIGDEAYPTNFGDDWTGGWGGESGNGENPYDEEGDELAGNSSSKGVGSRSSLEFLGDGKEPADSMAHRFPSGNRSNAVEAVVNPYHKDCRLELRPDHVNDEELRTRSSFSKMAKDGGRGMRAEDKRTRLSGMASPPPPAPNRSLQRPSAEMMSFGAPSRGGPLASSRGPMVLGSAAADDRCREMKGKANSNKILAAGRTGSFGSMDSSMRRYGIGSFSSRGDSVSSSMVPNTQDIDACFPPAGPEASGSDRRSSGKRLDPKSPPPRSIPRSSARAVGKNSMARKSGENGIGSRWCDKEAGRSWTKKRPRDGSTSPASVARRSQGSSTAVRKSHDRRGKRRGSGSNQAESGIVLALLGCEEWEIKRTKVLCRALGQRRLYTQLVHGVTHVVIGSKHTMEDESEIDNTKRRRHRLVNHGLEGYLEAVIMGLWVLDFSWVEACLEKIREDATRCRNELPQLALVRSFEMVGCMKDHDGCDARKSRKKRQANSSGGQCGASDRELFHGIIFHLVSGEERQSLRQEARLATLLELAGGSTSGSKQPSLSSLSSSENGSLGRNGHDVVRRKRPAVKELVVAVADDKDGEVSRRTAGAALERMADFPAATAAVNQSWILRAIEDAEKPSFADHGVASRATKRTMRQSPAAGSSSRYISGDPIDAMLMDDGDDPHNGLATEETSTKKEGTQGGSSGRLNVRSKRLRSNGVSREVVPQAEDIRHVRGRGLHGISEGSIVTKSGAAARKTRQVIDEASQIVRNYDRENRRRALRDARASATASSGCKERTVKGIEFTRVADLKGVDQDVDTSRPDYWDENYAKNLEEGAGVKPNSNSTGGPSALEIYGVTVALRKELNEAGYLRKDEKSLADFWFALVYNGMVAPSAEHYEQYEAARRGCPVTIMRRVFEKTRVALTEDADRRLRELKRGKLKVGELKFSNWNEDGSTSRDVGRGAAVAEQRTGKGVDSALEVS